MINNLSTRLANKLLERGSIEENERELYIYGLFMLFSHLMYLALACVFGMLFKCFIESIIFYIAFQFIRRYAGGYHAATETRCEIFSALSIFCCIAIIRVSKIYDIKFVLLGTALVCAVLIFILCPLDTPEKPLTEKEFKYFRKTSLIILFAITAAVIVSFIFKIQVITAPCCMSLILESTLLVAGKIKKVKKSGAFSIQNN